MPPTDKSPRVAQCEAELADLSAQIKPLVEKSQAAALSAEDDKRFDELTDQINKAGEALAKAINDDARSVEMLTLYQKYNTPADNVKRGISFDTATEPGPNGHGDGGSGSIGSQFVQSDELKDYRKHLKGASRPVQFKGLFPEYDRSSAGPNGQKALIYSGTGSASMLLPQVLPGIYRGAEAPLVMRDVLMNLNTTSDSLTVVTESGFTNSAAEVAEATLVSEGAKPESALTFTEASFPVRTIAHWVPITRQMLEDLPMMEGYVEQRLRVGLLRREDNQFLNGNGTPPNLTGILVTSGIQDLNAAHFTGAPVQDAASDNENINRIRRAKRVIQVTGDANATFAVINPTDLEMIDTITDSTRQYLLGGPLVAGPRRLWGLQVVESENIAAGTVLVGDGTMAAVVDRQDARIYMTDSHSDFFVRNIFVMLAEERVALPVFRAAAFAKVALAAWA
jgi:HK97 family phage major capsid protein